MKDDERACCARFLYSFRALAYASQDNTLDKAMVDLSKSEDPRDLDEHFATGYWAPLLRAAIRLHRDDLSSVGQDKADTGRKAKRKLTDILNSIGPGTNNVQYDFMMIVMDIQRALGTRDGAEAYAMMIYVLDKVGDQETAAEFREASKRGETTRNTAIDGEDVPMDAAFHKCFARLAPEIEKEAIVIREARARNSESPY